jgi:hypothetical protein
MSWSFVQVGSSAPFIEEIEVLGGDPMAVVRVVKSGARDPLAFRVCLLDLLDTRLKLLDTSGPRYALSA